MTRWAAFKCWVRYGHEMKAGVLLYGGETCNLCGYWAPWEAGR